MDDYKARWEQVYDTKAVDDVSWYQEHPELSLALIQGTGVAPEASIIDIGAGTSLLADHLIAAGFRDITLLDISKIALEITDARLKPTNANLTCLVGDITSIPLALHRYDVWHDRAVFHFLTDPLQQRQYVDQVRRAVKPGGHVIMATFALDGPEKCSGLNTARYDAASLHGVFGNEFYLLESHNETHFTPWGTEQRFVYCYCRKLVADVELCIPSI